MSTKTFNPFSVSPSHGGSSDTWSFELTNPAFNNAIAISNNVDPSLGSLTLQCPIVAAGYVHAYGHYNCSDF